jgi:hypothetical protein
VQEDPQLGQGAEVHHLQPDSTEPGIAGETGVPHTSVSPRVPDSPGGSSLTGDVSLEDAAAAAAALQDAADEREQLLILRVMVRDLKVRKCDGGEWGVVAHIPVSAYTLVNG